MAAVKIRHFVEKPGSKGPRYFWQPSAALRALGWRPERLPEALPAAIARAEELNRQLDAWRAGGDTAQLASTPPRGPQPGTVADLIRRYKASRFFTDKAPKTQRGYLQNIRVIEDWAGDIPVAAISPSRVQTLYDQLRAATPAKANAVVTMLRILLSHAVREGMVTVNAAEKPGMIGRPFAGKIWPVDAVALFVEVADRMRFGSIGTAVIVAHWIGQRPGDILAMPKGAYRDGRFWVTQSKTGARVAVPHSPWVAERIEAMLAARKVEALLPSGEPALLVSDATGKPWQEDTFRHVFADIRARVAEEWAAFEVRDGSTIETDGLLFRHLRHTAVTELAIAGCTPIEIAGITGHTIKTVVQILEHYLVRTTDLADAAAVKRLAHGDYSALFAKNLSTERGKNE
ncbi:MAG: tyrosine recombinase XerC [Rhodospirillaceae bacterium]